ncbi:MAG: NAD(+)/NADH kinase [Bacteroidales bacterium]|nr:NAD(+)/NADH kinase [Bacteroidales bacterium]
MTIAIYGSRRQEPYADKIAAFLDVLAHAGAHVVMHRKLYDVLIHLIPAHLAPVRKVVAGPDFKADCAVSIGGDGTLLRTAMWVGSKDIPIIGVNTGHLGYLSGATVEELPSLANELLTGSWPTESRTLMHVSQPELPFWPYALNEVAVAKEDTASMIIAHTSIGGALLANYRADGLVISTPTGSTAYNLSVGGPIIEPSAPVWALSPIAAHSLSMRPLVVSDDSHISIEVDGRGRQFRLTLDGRAVALPLGTRIEIEKAPFKLRLIVRPGHEFPIPLRQKLHWSE